MCSCTLEDTLCSVLSHLQLLVAPWTAARQDPLCMEFSRQEYWSGLPFLLLVIVTAQGSNPHLLCFLYWQVDSLPAVPPGKQKIYYCGQTEYLKGTERSLTELY